MKVYTIMCRYLFDGTYEDIPISIMLKRLHLEPAPIIDQESHYYGIDYRTDDVVRHNVENAFKVRYLIRRYSVKVPGPLEYDHITTNLKLLEAQMNDYHDEIIIDMNDDIDQIKGENYE